MKKTVLAVASILLAGSLVAFAGCDKGNNVGVIKGDYKEATAAEAAEAVKNIELDKAFGDPSAEDFKFGFELMADLSFSMNYSVSANSQTVSQMKADGGVEANYRLVIAPEGEAFSATGKGDVSVNANVNQSAAGKDTSSKSEMSANIYQDSEYLYLDAHIAAEGTERDQKIKLSFDDVIDAVIGGIGGAFTVIDDAETELPDGGISGGVDVEMNLGTVISALAEAGFTVSLDQSSGLKIKISAGKEFILGAIEDSDVQLPIPVEGMDFGASEIAIYLSFDESGKFVQAGVNVNITAAMEVSAQGSSVKADVNVKGGVELKLFNGTVTLPEGIADDESYELQGM